jgi:hypothetical protein
MESSPGHLSQGVMALESFIDGVIPPPFMTRSHGLSVITSLAAEIPTKLSKVPSCYQLSSVGNNIRYPDVTN